MERGWRSVIGHRKLPKTQYIFSRMAGRVLCTMGIQWRKRANVRTAHTADRGHKYIKYQFVLLSSVFRGVVWVCAVAACGRGC